MADDANEVRVNVRTIEQRRDRWKRYADEHDDVESMTHLIHRGVAEYIARHQRDGSATPEHGGLSGDTADAVVDRLDDIVTAVEGLDDRLASINDRLTTVESHVEPSGQVDVADVVSALPPARPRSERWHIAFREADANIRDSVVWDGSITGLADRFDVSDDRIKSAIDRIENSPIDVEKEVDPEDSTIKYWSPEHSLAADVVTDEEVREILRDAERNYGPSEGNPNRGDSE